MSDEWRATSDERGVASEERRPCRSIVGSLRVGFFSILSVISKDE
jgi:hypothetical protein